MSFDVSPRDYLTMLHEQHAEYRAQPLSLRKAIAVLLFANHIGEHVFASYSSGDPAKVGGRRSLQDYRSYLLGLKPELELIRDLCDFSKHGPSLNRKSVAVAKTELKETMVADYSGLLLGLMNHHPEDKIVVTLSDGSERFFDYLIDEAVQFWTGHFTDNCL